MLFILKKKASLGTTSQVTKDQLEELGKKIASKQKEAEEVIKNNDEQFEKNTEYINSPVNPIDDTIKAANELWNRRNRS
jgi:ABC-type Fe3+-hydroxamate transport system substrate-binding protein